MLNPQTHLLCHRCGCSLQPAQASFYIVRIEAFADPTAPHITHDDLTGDLEAQIESLIDQMRDSSERELGDQVHRRLTLHLCNRCYNTWIENPTEPQA